MSTKNSGEMNISATNASEAGKMRDPHALETYMSDMVSNSDRKAGLITSHFPETEDGDIVIDLGSCTGELIHMMKINFPNLKFIGIDLSEQMLSAARKKEKESSFVLANVLEPPIKREVAKVIVMSSIFHELYSYGGGGFSLDSAKYGLILAFSLLKRGGRLIIKDPAKPEEPDEMLVFRLRKDDGDNPNPTELYTVHPDKLSTYSKYLRFQHDFSQTKRAEVEYLDDKDQFLAPAWYLSEFLRHRTLTDTLPHWESEMLEQYGVFTASEMKHELISIGFSVITVKDYFNDTNHAAIRNGDVKIWSLDGKEVDQATRLPTNLLVVAEKR